jgi:hypothetical protein
MVQPSARRQYQFQGLRHPTRTLIMIDVHVYGAGARSHLRLFISLAFFLGSLCAS